MVFGTSLLEHFFCFLSSHSVLFEKGAKGGSSDPHADISSGLWIKHFLCNQVWQVSSSGCSIGERALVSGAGSFAGKLTSSSHRRN
jgi:hypothetical protein